MKKGLGDFVAEARARIQQISPDELSEKIDRSDNFLLIDVREAEEFVKGHIRDALLIPRGVLEGAADPNYKKRHRVLCQSQQAQIIVYCESGGRSALAVDTLNQMGFIEVYNLAGGIQAWEAEDYPIITDIGQPSV